MSKYDMIIQMPESTVVSEYEPIKNCATAYQTEAELEQTFIDQLCSQGYEYIKIRNSDELILNLRHQLENLNNITFTDNEWNNFFTQKIANPNFSIEDKTRIYQEDYIQVLERDNGTICNITLIDKNNIHNNKLQVINQYTEKNGNHINRYDDTILVNGLPSIHIELKRRGVAIKEAFNQIERYQSESFWANSGLYEYIQIFVISNGTNTKYYSNTTRFSAIKERRGGYRGNKTSNSFEFTSFWADANNNTIRDLVDFTRTFFAKHTILNILTKYCVFTSDKILLVMRPYQISATERIINRIEVSTNYKKLGTVDAGGYIWHATGSGKSLTAFKTARLASDLPNIDKVIFAVDRKDLDYQTIKEYDRFEKGAANGSKNTSILKRQLENIDSKGNPHKYKIIITTIQKLDNFIKKNPFHPVYNEHVVMIFDECHRSQFGEMRNNIVKHFKNYHFFGFTGTPIFPQNSGKSVNSNICTTEQAFGDRLHTYTVVDAIRDNNVLPFKIDYVCTMKQKEINKDKKVEAIDTEASLLDPERIKKVSSYILEHFDKKTMRNRYYTHNRISNVAEMSKNANSIEKRQVANVNGFNSIFTVSSIEAAKLYYTELKKQINANTNYNLKIATIFSYSKNEGDFNSFIDDEDSDTTDGLDISSRDFLESAIQDYNKMFNTAYDTSSEKFSNYYKDISLRMKNREIDLLIVVNMFLTGFDATTVNTLWVDRSLYMHGLFQALSRTNRILNSIKTFGNIVCFRDLEEETNEAIALFGDKDAKGVVLLKSYNDYYNGYDDNKKHYQGYKEQINELITKYPLNKNIIGETSEKEFISLFGAILKTRNILSTFDEFTEKAEIITPFDMQNYTGIYNDLHDKYRSYAANKEYINDDITFEMELVKQVEVNIDYILFLIEKYHKSNCEDKSIIIEIEKAIKSSIELRSKKMLIDTFVSTISPKTNVNKAWPEFIKEQQRNDLNQIINEEKLNPSETKKYLSSIFRDGQIKTNGTDIDKILPPLSRFGFGGDNREEKKQSIINKLQAFFEKYYGLETINFDEE